MDDIVEQVKQANRIEDVIEEFGFPLQRRHGRYLRGRDHDSLVVDTLHQTYSWNSQNERAGDVIEWCMVRRKWDFKTAVEHLASRARLAEPKWSQQDNATRLANRAREEIFQVAQEATAAWLWADAEALAYCRGRGWSDETIREAGLGFTGRGAAAAEDMRGTFAMHGIDPDCPAAVAILGYRGDVKRWGEQHQVAVQENWIEWGLVPGLISKTRIVYPHWVGGRVRTFTSRNVFGAEINREGREVKAYNLPVVLAGDRQLFYNHAYGPRAEECVLVEGQADAVTLGQWGIPAAALAGTAWKDHQAILGELRKRHGRLYVGLDGDQAGWNALIGGQKEWPLGQLLGPMVRVVRWPETHGPDGQTGKDANDWLRWGMKSLELNAQVKAASGALEGARTMVENAAAWAGMRKGAERDEAIKTAFGLIGRMEKVERAQYRSQLAELLNVGIREFNDILKATAEATDDEERPIEIVETLGGDIGGWLVEYMYDPEEDRARLAYRDPDRRVGEAEHLDIDGVRYIPRNTSKFVKDGGVLFPSKLGPLKGTRELVAIVEAFIHEHYLLEDRYLGRIMAYYVLLTWVYDAFNALCYLRAMGEAGAGKSELMRRVGYVCYRMMAASGANSAASFFRATETYRGTVFIDEADLHDGGDMSNDLVKFLNLGAMKGNPIWRLEEVQTENGKTYEPATYSTYCPKLIAMRKDFRDDAVGSRSLTIRLMPREPIELKARGIRLYVDDEFRARALAIRNMLLRWRLQVWEPEIPVTEDHMDLEISSRLNQVTMPLKALAKDDIELAGEIERFLRAYNQEMVLNRAMTVAARVVEAMWKIHNEGTLKEKYLKKGSDGETEYMMIKDVAGVANSIIDEMNTVDTDEGQEDKPAKRKRDELSARGVGHIIRNELQLHVGERRGNGFPVFWDELKLQGLAKRYGVVPSNGTEPGGQQPGGQVAEMLKLL